MMNISPLGIIAALVVVGVSIEAVEAQSKRAAYALVIVVLLSIIVFNQKAFTQQINGVIALLSAKPRKPDATSTPAPTFRK